VDRLVRPKEEITQTLFQNQQGYTKGFNRLADISSEGSLGQPVHYGFLGSSRIGSYMRLHSISGSPVLNGPSNGSAAAASFAKTISQSQSILPLRMLPDPRSEFS